MHFDNTKMRERYKNFENEEANHIMESFKERIEEYVDILNRGSFKSYVDLEFISSTLGANFYWLNDKKDKVTEICKTEALKIIKTYNLPKPDINIYWNSTHIHFSIGFDFMELVGEKKYEEDWSVEE